ETKAQHDEEDRDRAFQLAEVHGSENLVGESIDVRGEGGAGPQRGGQVDRGGQRGGGRGGGGGGGEERRGGTAPDREGLGGPPARHGAFGNTQAAGGFLARPPLQVAEDDDRPVLLRQPAQLAVEQALQVGRGVGPGRRARERGGTLLLPTHPAGVHGAGLDGN